MPRRPARSSAQNGLVASLIRTQALAAGGQPVHDVRAGCVLLRGVHRVFDVQDDGVRPGDGGLVEELGFHCVDQQPGAGDFGWDVALGRMVSAVVVEVMYLR